VAGQNNQQVLLADDVREIMPRGLAINDEADLCTPEDLVRHRELLNIRFRLMDKVVKTKRHKLGKISDYAYDQNSMFVEKLYVMRPLVKMFASEDTLIVGRNQIVEITDKYILVKDADVTETEEEPEEEMASTAEAVPST
jgi:sporulation protein YlmC with PRC-barrel domain